MILIEFLDKVLDKELIKADQYKDIVQVEMPDETYVDIKEIFYLANPDRIIIRLEEKK